MALGTYHPEAVLPQEADPELGGGQPEVCPVFASEAPVSVGHHALFLDIITVGAQTIRARQKYTILSLTEEDRGKRNGHIEQNQKNHDIQSHVNQDHTTQQLYSQLMGLLRQTSKD